MVVEEAMAKAEAVAVEEAPTVAEAAVALMNN